MNNNIPNANNKAGDVNGAYLAAFEKYHRLKAEYEQAKYEMREAYVHVLDYKSFTPNGWDAYINFEEEEALRREETI